MASMDQSVEKIGELLKALQKETVSFADNYCDQVNGCENCPIRTKVGEIMNASPSLLKEEQLVACEYF